MVRFLAAGTHDVEGWRSPVGWLKANAAVTDREAKRLVARVERLRQWPALANLWFQGEVTGAQIEVAAAVVPRTLVDLYAAHDAEVSPYLVGLGLADTRSAFREWVLRAEAVTAPDPADVDAAAEVDARVHLSRTLAGRGVLDGDLDALTAELLETALRVVERPDAPGEFRSAAERRAESLRRMARFTLDHYATKGDRPGRQHPHLLAVMDLPDLYAAMLRGLGIRTASDLELFCALRPTSVVEEGLLRHALAEGTGAVTTLDGHRLGVDAVLEIFGAGTTIERLLTADGRVLDHGRSVRLADAPLRDALLVRDRGCRFPDCDAKAEWVHAHHVEHWSAGGTTALANLAGLCASHHGVVHRDGWSVAASSDGTLTFTRPDGESVTSPHPEDIARTLCPSVYPISTTSSLIPWTRMGSRESRGPARCAARACMVAVGGTWPLPGNRSRRSGPTRRQSGDEPPASPSRPEPFDGVGSSGSHKTRALLTNGRHTMTETRYIAPDSQPEKMCFVYASICGALSASATARRAASDLFTTSSLHVGTRVP